VAALAILILVPFGLLFNNVTLGFTYHLSYLHTYIQRNNADCRWITYAQDLKIASALTYGILPRRLQVYLPLAHSSLTHYHMTTFLTCSHPLIYFTGDPTLILSQLPHG
jgi:hypothetical protein